MSEPLLITARDQSGSRRATERMGHVSIRTENSVGGQGIYVRCRDIRAPIETYAVVTQIVRKNNNDIWMIGLRENRGSKSGNVEQQSQKTFLCNTQLARAGSLKRCGGLGHNVRAGVLRWFVLGRCSLLT